MSQHFKTLGILYLVMAGFILIAAFTVSFFLQIASPHVNDFDGQNVINILSVVLPILLFFLSAPSIVAGIGLLYQKQWALILATILAVFNIFSFPLGTGLSIYTFYVLIKQNDIRREEQLRESTKIVG